MDHGEAPGRLLIIGGAEDRCCGAGALECFAELRGGAGARIVLVTTATGSPDHDLMIGLVSRRLLAGLDAELACEGAR